MHFYWHRCSYRVLSALKTKEYDENRFAINKNRSDSSWSITPCLRVGIEILGESSCYRLRSYVIEWSSMRLVLPRPAFKSLSSLWRRLQSMGAYRVPDWFFWMLIESFFFCCKLCCRIDLLRLTESMLLKNVDFYFKARIEILFIKRDSLCRMPINGTVYRAKMFAQPSTFLKPLAATFVRITL